MSKFVVNKIKNMTVYLTISCDDNPIATSIIIFFAYLFFNLILGHIESLAFGRPIQHWFDLLFAFGFMYWAIYAIYVCACRKIIKIGESDEVDKC